MNNNLPLERKWTIWFDAPFLHDSQNKYSNELIWINNIQKVYTFDSVINFWGSYNNISPIEEISYRSSYYIYEYNTKPIWRDLNNLNGGNIKFYIPFDYYDAEDDIEDIPNKKNIQDMWLYCILSIIGKTVPYNLEITGIYISKLKQYCELGITVRTDNKKVLDSITEYFMKKFKNKDVEIDIEYEKNIEKFK